MTKNAYRKPRMTVVNVQHQECLMTGSIVAPTGVKELNGSASTETGMNPKWMELG